MGYSNRTWSCPFFGWDERLAVHCEGGVLRFRDRQALQSYAGMYCAHVTGWKRCTVAANLADCYDRAGVPR